MPSATDFLPSSMTLFMNLVRTTSPKRGSGRTSRFSGRRRRDIFSSFCFSRVRNGSGAYCQRLLGTLGTIFGTGLAAILDTLGVENAAQDVIANAGKVANAAAADEDDAML